MKEQLFVVGYGPGARVLVADDAAHAAEQYCELNRMTPLNAGPTGKRIVCVAVRELVDGTQEWGEPTVYEVTVRRSTTYSARPNAPRASSELTILPSPDAEWAGAIA